MRVLLDTNIVLDVLLERPPFVEDAKKIWQSIEASQLTGYLAASIITDIFYIVRKQVGLEKAHRSIEICLDTFEIGTVDAGTIKLASALPGSDFEDNVLIACALSSNLDAIVTRNKADFKTTAIPVIEPAELLTQLPAPPTSPSSTPTPQS